MRVLFAGTPEAAVASLSALLASHHEVVAVLTRPDAAVGRGRSLRPSPVAETASGAGLETLKYTRPRDEAFQRRLEELAPDACAIVAYGGLIPPAALAVPPHGWINLHFSLLPAWRGAAPVQHAIWHGDDITGACTFRLEEGLDTGPVYGTVTERVRPTDTSGDLLERLAEVGAGLLVATLDGVEDGALQAVPQPADGVTLAPKITVEDARVDFAQPAVRVDRQIRACTPAPGAWTTLEGERIALLPVRPDREAAAARLGAALEEASPGTLLPSKKAVWVATATDPVLLGEVTPQGKRTMAAADWMRGVRVRPGARFR